MCFPSRSRFARRLRPADRLPFLTEPEVSEDEHDDDHDPDDVEDVVHAHPSLRQLLVTDERGLRKGRAADCGPELGRFCPGQKVIGVTAEARWPERARVTGNDYTVSER